MTESEYVPSLSLQQQVIRIFHDIYGRAPEGVVRSPGRVNLIGDHTDYNDGFVLPMAIDRQVWLAFRKNGNRQVSLHSAVMSAPVVFSLDAIRRQPGHWGEYVQGVAWALQETGRRLHGFDGVMISDIPIGSGLSSSAALEMAATACFARVSGFHLVSEAMAVIGQTAENRWVGVHCGIMDQLICAGGIEDGALLIDCRDLTVDPVRLPAQAAVVVLDTGTRRELADSAYNERRSQCGTAAAAFGIPSLRDLDPATLSTGSPRLDPVVHRRALHVVTENRRTQDAAAALRAGDAAGAGILMNRSHESLRDDYEVSSPALDAIVGCAQADADCYGARMTGAGFGGCAVALIRADRQESFAARVAESYRSQTGLEPAVHVCRAVRGTEVEKIEVEKL